MPSTKQHAMTPRALALLAALALCACATVTDETRTTAVIEGGYYHGERYEIRERTLQGQTGTFEQTSVVYRGLARTCIKDSLGDCTKTALALIEFYQEAWF